MDVLNDTPIRYFLSIENNKFEVNQYLGKLIQLKFTNNLYCIKCNRKSSKLYGQGFCYPCFLTAPEAEECVLRPELCRAHEGNARDMNYAQTHCLIEHFVYLASNDTIKVGVTRSTQIPNRWIDQGAMQAIIIATTQNRYTAGMIEIELKKHLPDKTNWRNMLMNKIIEPDFVATFEFIKNIIPNNYRKHLTFGTKTFKFIYPVIKYPQTIKSIDLLKQPKIEGKLIGIKGQYLIFDTNEVINVRKHSGFEVELVCI